MSDLPEPYARVVRTLLRFAVAATIFALLSGILYQESAKKLTHDAVEPGLHLRATLSLALVHGHVFVSAVLIPIAMAGALVLARAAGGSELGTRPLVWLTRVYLPFVTLTLVLMIWKAYHVLLLVRWGETELAAIDARFFFGAKLVRHLVYGATHVGMALGLGVFVVALWRSLGRPRPSA